MRNPLRTVSREPRRPTRVAAQICVCLTLYCAPSLAASQSSESALRAFPLWHVTAQPDFDTQAAPSNESTPLLEASGAMRFASGSVVVADQGAFNIKFYTPDGRLVREVGRRGSGPGEYQTPRVLGACGSQHVLIYDGALGRITVLDDTGRLVETWRIAMSESERAPPMTIVCGRGRQAALLGWTPDVPTPNTSTPVAHRGEVLLNVRVMARDGATERVGRFRGPDRMRWPTSDGPRPLGRATHVAVGATRLYVGTADSSAIEVRAIDARGVNRTPRAPIALPFERQRIERADITRFVDRVIALNPNYSADQLRARYADMEFPTHFPTHGELRTDPDGNLWVEQYRQPGEMQSLWIVFDRDGRPRGRVVLPDRFRLLEIDATGVLGTWEDADEVLRLRAYRLQSTTHQGNVLLVGCACAVTHTPP
jgi:hypothetical protein